MNKKAGIYDPYLDTLGGGERYCLTVAEVLIKNGWQVDLFWSGSHEFIEKAANRFHLKLDKLSIQPDIFLQPEAHIEKPKSNALHSKDRIKQTLFAKINTLLYKKKITSQYDLLFYVSDGSVPLLFSKKNILHMQVPFITKTSLTDRIKYRNINSLICNSKFTSLFYKTIPTSINVVYPPVDVDSFKGKTKKENKIISVGRFDNVLNAKKQDVLVDAFRKFNEQNKGQWKLILAGGSLNPEENNYLKHLKYLAKNLPIEIVVNPSFTKLVNLYQRSKIYWHAAGYNVNPKIHPESTEHFGISVVEAMAAGCVPIVVNNGGLPEIVIDNKNGYLWETTDQLIAKTQLLSANTNKWQELSNNAINSVDQFSKSQFEKYLLEIINE